MKKQTILYSITKLILVALLAMPFGATAQISIGNDLSKIDYSSPTEYTIGGITVSGIEFLDKNVIIMLSDLEVGKKIRIPGDNISSAIRKLWDQGLFEDIKVYATDIKGDKIFLDIYLKERPRLNKFSFTGVKKTAADDIREKINLTRGDVVTEHLKIRTANQKTFFFDVFCFEVMITDFYKEMFLPVIVIEVV